MKKYLLFLLLPSMLIGCGLNAEQERLQAEIDRLKQESSTKDADIDGFIGSLTNIQDNLDSIKALEGIVTAKATGDAGKNATAEEDILGDMRAIYDKMRKNREQISELEKQLKQSSISSEKLNKLIAKLKSDLADKDAEIEVLRDKLAKADIYIDALMADIDNLAVEGERKTEVIQEKDRQLSAKEKELLTAYYVIGTKKELMERGIIDRQGAFLGMGGTKKVAGNVAYEDLTRINIYETKEFSIGGKKAEVVSTHPNSSYELVGSKTFDKLVVSDPDAFWKNSKVLVIVTP